MSESKRPLKVFLCHAHADCEPVRALYARLKCEGVYQMLSIVLRPITKLI